MVGENLWWEIVNLPLAYLKLSNKLGGTTRPSSHVG